MGMEQIITRGMRHARQGETGQFSHRLPVCSSSNQAFRSPFSHLGYGWIFWIQSWCQRGVILQTLWFFEICTSFHVFLLTWPPIISPPKFFSTQGKANAEPSDGYLEHYTNGQLHVVCLTEVGLAGWVRASNKIHQLK